MSLSILHNDPSSPFFAEMSELRLRFLAKIELEKGPLLGSIESHGLPSEVISTLFAAITTVSVGSSMFVVQPLLYQAHLLGVSTDALRSALRAPEPFSVVCEIAKAMHDHATRLAQDRFRSTDSSFSITALEQSTHLLVQAADKLNKEYAADRSKVGLRGLEDHYRTGASACTCLAMEITKAAGAGTSKSM